MNGVHPSGRPLKQLEVKFQNTNIIFWGWFLAVGSHLVSGKRKRWKGFFFFTINKILCWKELFFFFFLMMLTYYFSTYFLSILKWLPKKLLKKPIPGVSFLPPRWFNSWWDAQRHCGHGHLYGLPRANQWLAALHRVSGKDLGSKYMAEVLHQVYE